MMILSRLGGLRIRIFIGKFIRYFIISGTFIYAGNGAIAAWLMGRQWISITR